MSADGRGISGAGLAKHVEGDLRSDVMPAPRISELIAAGAAAQAAQENFPVALRLLPGRPRRHLAAVYAYARTVDDIGDEAPQADRMRLLADLECDVRMLFAASEGAADLPELGVVRDLAATISECGIPAQPFLDLIEANRQDQLVSRYESFDDLLGYCQLSANPVGRIVLHVFSSFSPERGAMSDRICSGLQLAEHWQDVAEDFRAGRIYLPQHDLRAFGCTEEDLAGTSAPRGLRDLMAFEVARARSMIDAGAPLIRTLRGSARAAVAGYVAGGRAALAAIADARYDVLGTVPRPRRSRTAGELALAWARGR